MASDSPAAASRPLRQQQKEMTRQRLIDAGFDVFTERGYAAATVEEITERAQVGRTTFYTHFQGKLDVAFAVAFQHTAGLHQTLASLGTVDPLDQCDVEAWLDRVEHEFQNNRVAVALVIQATVSDSAAAQHFLNAQRGTVQEVLEGLRDAGYVLRDDAAGPLQVMLILVNRWMFLSCVQEASIGVSRRELRRLLMSELRRCLKSSEAHAPLSNRSEVEGQAGAGRP